MTHIRHQLHRMAELSGNEKHTHDFIVEHLRELCPTHLHTNVGGYGVVAAWLTTHTAPTIALRADIDALPIKEILDKDYISASDGVSHKCGHDGHSAILLRTAELIHSEKPLCNTILIFQPEEETGQGARKILDSKILEQYNINKIFGFHNLPHYPTGCVVIKHNTFAAASTGMTITLQGRPTHAAHPEKGINPTMAVAQIIMMINQECANLSDNPQAVQATPIHIHVGNVAFGTSAGEAQVMYTLRAWNNHNMTATLLHLENEISKICLQHNLTHHIEYCEAFSAVDNTAAEVETIHRAAQKLGMPIQWIDTPFRWSEDFAEYLKHYKGAYFGIGAGTDSLELHHPQYNFNDEIIEPTARLLVECLS